MAVAGAFDATTDVRRTPGLSRAQGIVGWTTFGVVLLAVVPYGANDPVYWIALAVLIMPLFVAQCVLLALRGVPRSLILLAGPALLWIAVLVWGIVQTLPVAEALAHPDWARVDGVPGRISTDPLAGRHIVLRLATYGMVFWIVAAAAQNRQRAVRFLQAFALASLALAIWGLGVRLVGTNPLIPGDTRPYVVSTFINRNSYATYAAMGMIANLAVYIHLVRERGKETSQRRRLRALLERFFRVGWIYAFGFLLCLSALLLSESRGGFLSGMVGLAVFALASAQSFRRNLAIWVPVLLGFGLYAVALSSNVMARVFGVTTDARFILYPKVWEGALDRPWLGHGLGAFEDAFQRYLPQEAAIGEWEKAHNSYLENAFELGLPAAVLMYAALGWIAVGLFRGALVRTRYRLFVTVALPILVIGALHSLVDFSLQMPASAAMFAALLAIGWTHAIRTREG